MIKFFFTRPKHDFTHLGRVDVWLGRTLGSGNLYNDTGKALLKHKNFVIYLALPLQNHFYSPCPERPPVLRDLKI